MTGIVVALGATSFVVASASNNEAQAAVTDCWDEYSMTGTTVQRVITPKGVSVGNCTVPTVCLDGYSSTGSTPNRIYAPHGLPKSFCSPPPPPATTQPPPPATTQPPPPATTQPPPPATTQPPPPATTQPPPPATTQPPPPATTQPPPPPTTQPPTGAFVATFDTAADFYNRFETYTGNYCTSGTNCRPSGSFPGSHDTACTAPPSTRSVNVGNHNNLFWWCAPGGAATGHVMSALNTSGYSLLTFAPKQSFTNVRQVCWDQSLANLGGGKWNNVVLVPEATYLSHPNTNPRRVEDGEGPYRMDYVTPGFHVEGGPGDFNIQDLGSGAGAIVGVKQFVGTSMIYRGTSTLGSNGSAWNAGSDESTRFRHCFRDNRNGTLTYTQQRSTGLHTVTTNGAFPTGPVRVLFQDDTYNADGHSGTGRYTWHWDNITIE